MGYVRYQIKNPISNVESDWIRCIGIREGEVDRFEYVKLVCRQR
jgi:hypothetical protein